MMFDNDQNLQNQKNNRGLLTAVLIVLIILLVVLSIATFVLIRLGRIQTGNIKINPTSEVSSATQVVVLPPTSAVITVKPTYTALPTFTPDATYTAQATYTFVPTNTEITENTAVPTNTRTPYVTPTFMFNVNEVLYLDSSIYANTLWNPDQATPTVEEGDRIAILQLVKDAQTHREYVWRYEDTSDLDLYNSGLALTQMQDYYDYYIDTGDGCYKDIEIVGNQFHTIIIAYDGYYARTMTMKVESRNTICNGTSTYWVPNDGYAYELKMQKFGDTWKIIEHPLGNDPSQ